MEFKTQISWTKHNLTLYVIIMSRTNFRLNLHSIVCLNVKELLAQSRHNILSLSDSNGIWTHNHLVCKRTLSHLASLVKWLIVCLRTKWLWVQILLLSQSDIILFLKLIKYYRVLDHPKNTLITEVNIPQ